VNQQVAAYCPSVPLENLTVSEVYQKIRTSYDTISPILRHNVRIDIASPILERIEQSIQKELGELTVKQLIEMDTEQQSVNFVTAKS